MKELEKETNFVNRKTVKHDFAQIGAMIIADLNVNASSSLTKSYSRADVTRFLASPQRYSKDLANMSMALYQASPHYRRLINYFAFMPTLDYIIEPVGLDFSKSINDKAFRTSYQRSNDLIDLMDIKHEFKKALKIAWIKDTFYGYEHITKDSYFIQQLPNDYCQISSMEDGVYNFSMDFSYFDRNPTQLDFYPKEFKSMYNKFKSGSQGKWQELDSQNTVCLKINEEVTYDIPPFVGIFASIYDIEDYKALKIAKETMNNYKFIVQKIPLREKSERNNDFLIDLTNVAMFHNKTSSVLPDGVGLITTPFEVDTINFSKTTAENDNVQEAERQLYSSAGTSQMLFNGDKSATANLNKSITVDESDVFMVLRQIERFLNRKIKSVVKGVFRFKIKILDLTDNNKSDVVDSLLKSAQFGLPVKMMLGASLGLSPSAVVNMAYLENTILDLANQFIPLASSHTQSGGASGAGGATGASNPTNQGGRPQSNPNDITPSGQASQDAQANGGN